MNAQAVEGSGEEAVALPGSAGGLSAGVAGSILGQAKQDSSDGAASDLKSDVDPGIQENGNPADVVND